jgi:hypothetical protein
MLIKVDYSRRGQKDKAEDVGYDVSFEELASRDVFFISFCSACTPGLHSTHETTHESILKLMILNKLNRTRTPVMHYLLTGFDCIKGETCCP